MRRTEDMEYGTEWTRPEHTLWGATKRLFQNQFVRFKEIQKAILASGGEITEDMDVEQAELHVKGAIAEDLRDIRQSFVLPVVQLLAEHGITLNEFDAFLYARHAAERNDHIWEINPEFREFGIPGSGMSNEEAELILQDFAVQEKTPHLEAAASIVEAMNAERLDTMIESGLEARENIDLWRSRYEHYVPLKGTQDGRHIQRIRPGKGFDMSGKNLIAAFGRRNQADSPFMNAVLQMQETAMRARKADVGQKLYRLMGAYHNEDVYQLYSPQQKLRARFNNQTGEVEYVPDHQLPDDVIRVRVDGKVKYIKLVDPLLLRAFKRLHDNDISRVEQVLLRVNRYLSTVNTSLNPEFLVSNIARDFQTALHHMAAERDIGKLQGQSLRQMSGRMLKDLPSALKGIYSTLRKETHGGKLEVDHDGNPIEGTDDVPTEWERWFHRFRHSGAMTGFYDMRDMDSMKDEIESLIKEAHGGKMASLRKAFRFGKDAVANLNSAAENATRLVAFRIAIEQGGLSEREAATLARTLTVNFNRRGELGVVMNAMYLFYNAGIQGTAQMLKAMRSPSVQRIAAGTVGFAFALAMMNRMAAGEDDDGENYYDLLPDSMLERNMVIALGNGKWITIPLPYGYNIFHVMGTQLARIMQGKSGMSASLAVVRAAATSFMPIATDSSADASTFFLKMLSPTISDPLVELAVNENAFGAPIYRSRPNSGGNQVPASQLPMRNTSETAKWFADFMNSMSGGNEVYAGWADISPDAIEHLVEFATGAAGAFTSRSVKAAGNLFSGDETEIKDVPFLRRAMAETPEWTATQRFYEAARVVDAAGDVRKNEARKPVREREEMPAELEAVQHLTGQLKRVNSRLQVLYKRRARAVADSRLDDEAREARLEELNNEIKRLQKQFGLKYEKARQAG